jgi:hypothetical protein
MDYWQIIFREVVMTGARRLSGIAQEHKGGNQAAHENAGGSRPKKDQSIGALLPRRLLWKENLSEQFNMGRSFLHTVRWPAIYKEAAAGATHFLPFSPGRTYFWRQNSPLRLNFLLCNRPCGRKVVA